MLRLKHLVISLCLISFWFILSAANITCAQALKVIYDGRAEESSTSKPSGPEIQLIRRYALPGARQMWRNSEVCQENFEPIDVASGSFTKPNTSQQAVLYRFCVTGHDFANNGIAIMENGRVVAQILYEGGETSSIKPIPDINNDGLFEMLLIGSTCHQGYCESYTKLIEVSSSVVKKFGAAEVFEDTTGALESRGKTAAYVLSVKIGSSPVFYRETYLMRNKRWIRSGFSTRYSLAEDRSTYNVF